MSDNWLFFFIFLFIYGSTGGVYIINTIRRHSNKQVESSVYLCEGCGHHFSYHGPDKKGRVHCNHQTTDWICDCVVFVGVEPIAVTAWSPQQLPATEAQDDKPDGGEDDA